jgi:flagellar assembly protein FliH
MAGVIKAGKLESQREREQSQTVFTLEDIELRRGAMLTEVRSQAADILKQAQKEAEVIRSQAVEDGMAEARQKADADIRMELAEQANTLLPAVEQLLQELQLAKQDWKKHWNASVLDLAAAIARKIVRRELASQPQISQDLIAESVELAAGAKQIQLQFHPQDLDSLTPLKEQLQSQFSPLGETILCPDESIEPGFCRIRTEFGQIDQTLATQLQRIVAELQ